MSLKAGIVGMPNVGKSTLFNAITSSQVRAANYPFATIEPNVGVVKLIDERLNRIAELVKPEKVINATIEFTDIAGLVKGASKGEGLGNKFLSNIRQVDAIVHVVRCFSGQRVTHVSGEVDPISDLEVIGLELLLADMSTIERVLARVQKRAIATNDKDLLAELSVALKLQAAFAKEKVARSVILDEEETKIANGYNLLTLKPIIYVANISEEFVANPMRSPLYKKLHTHLSKVNVPLLAISAQFESDLASLDDADKRDLIHSMGLAKSGLDSLTRQTFDLLKLATYFTAGKQEVRAWTFKQGLLAPQCAGLIHTDFEKGFIRAEIVAFDSFVAYNGWKGARDKGHARLEGRDYKIIDGDVVLFRFAN